MEKIIILGNGGHARSMADVIRSQNRYEIMGYISNDKNNHSVDYPIIGTDDDLLKIYNSGIYNAAIGIGFLGRSPLRKQLYNILKRIGYSLPVICDPSACISPNVIIEEGVFIGKKAIVNINAHVGKMSIINTGAIVEHDCKVGNFSHISVGTVLCGGVVVGEESFVGANATVIQNINIASNSMIGAGQIIKRSILDSK